MRRETQLVQDFAHQATMDLQSVLPALQVIGMKLLFSMCVSISCSHVKIFKERLFCIIWHYLRFVSNFELGHIETLLVVQAYLAAIDLSEQLQMTDRCLQCFNTVQLVLKAPRTW